MELDLDGNMSQALTMKNESNIDKIELRSWQMWCRLCAKDAHDNVYIFDQHEHEHITNSRKDLLAAIEKLFCIDIFFHEQLPKFICTECYSFIQKLVNFEKCVTKVQEMFESIISYSNVDTANQYALRQKHELLNEGPEYGHPHPVIFLSETLCHNTKDDVNFIENNPLEVSLKEGQKCFTQIFDNETRKDLKQNIQSKKSEKLYAVKKEEHRMNVRKKYSCNECSRKFTHKCDLKSHLKYVHEEDVNDLREYKCTHCSRVFNRKNTLNKHLNIHLPLEQQTFVSCPQCNVKVKPQTLKSHIQLIHVNVHPYLCEECGGVYRTIQNLNEHKLTHTDYTPFVCGYCNKGFKAEKWLKKHMDIHDPNTHICKICNAELKSRLTLRRHMLVHSNEKPHKCDYCGCSFKRAKTLKAHLISHTGLKPYACDFCDRSFTNGANCRSHKRKVHPDELAAQEAAGVQQCAQNIPNLATLKALTKSTNNLLPIVAKRGE